MRLTLIAMALSLLLAACGDAHIKQVCGLGILHGQYECIFVAEEPKQ